MIGTSRLPTVKERRLLVALRVLGLILVALIYSALVHFWHPVDSRALEFESLLETVDLREGSTTATEVQEELGPPSFSHPSPGGAQLQYLFAFPREEEPVVLTLRFEGKTLVEKTIHRP